jgi:hypothetical protein
MNDFSLPDPVMVVQRQDIPRNGIRLDILDSADP